MNGYHFFSGVKSNAPDWNIGFLLGDVHSHPPHPERVHVIAFTLFLGAFFFRIGFIKELVDTPA